MKLSMWILADRLKEYEPKCYIKDGYPTIRGVRFFTSQLDCYPADQIYIGSASDVFTDERYTNTILLAHGHDTMIIENHTIDTVLNEILTSFDFYNAWEALLWEASSMPDALQKIIDISNTAIDGLISISNLDSTILATTKEFDRGTTNERWLEAFDKKMVPLGFSGSPTRTSDGEIANDWSMIPTKYQTEGIYYIGAYIEADNEPVACYYVQENADTLTEVHCQLSNVVCSVISSVIKTAGRDINLQSNQSVVKDLLLGKKVVGSQIERLKERLGGEGPWLIITISSTTLSDSPTWRGSLEIELGQYRTKYLSLAYENNVAVLIREVEIGLFLTELKQHLNIDYFSIGVSLPVRKITKIPSAYRQSLFAIAQSEGEAGVHDASEYAFDYLLTSMREASEELDLLHPSLPTLKEYDDLHNTELLNTLYQHIMCERNTLITAKALHIHRNTLSYRLQRIESLIGMDLEDTMVRTHILLSFLIKHPSLSSGGAEEDS